MATQAVESKWQDSLWSYYPAGSGTAGGTTTLAMPPVGHPSNRQADGPTGGHYAIHAAAQQEACVEISPRDSVRRHGRSWNGVSTEIMQATRQERIDFRFHGPRHLLIAYEKGSRTAGETEVEGAPRSALRDIARKLIFVPAGHAYRDWQVPRVLPQATILYLDPALFAIETDPDVAISALAPRLYFEDATVAGTVQKLRSMAESQHTDNRLYCETLGVVLAHELAQSNAASTPLAPIRGGLASWQQRIMVDYIEAHLAEHVSITTLAGLVRLSPYHFCRAFKRSFGVPPHRYHMQRRIEHAKTMFAEPLCSVTDVGMTLGFVDTSSFSTAFRKMTGLTPSAYRRECH
jgi:AraC family transcriptional regulator